MSEHLLFEQSESLVGGATEEPNQSEQPVGWAESVLHASMRAPIVVGIAIWSVVVIIAVWAAPEVDGPWPLTVVYVLLSCLALAAARDRLPLWVTMAGLSAAVVATWAVAEEMDGLMSFATAWAVNLANAVIALLMVGRSARWSSFLVGLLVPVALWVVHPDWLSGLVLASAVTGVALRRGGRLGVKPLYRFARRVDQETEALWREQYRAEVVKAATREAANKARVVHDTAVNTLGAVASGGAAVADRDAVRQLCGRDVQTLEAILADQEVDADLELDSLGGPLGLVVDRRGLDDAELIRISKNLDEQCRRALLGAVWESMRNVTKHAGTSAIELEVRLVGQQLEVRIADRGRGFDGRVIAGRGLAESVFARCEEVGIIVALDTTPGRGTELRFTCSLTESTDATARGHVEVSAAEADGLGEDFGATVRAIRLQAGWLLCAGIVGVGVIIEFVNRFGVLSPTYGMHVVASVGGLLAWSAGRDGRRLGLMATVMLVFSVPLTFILAMWGTDFGRHDLIYWQCLGPAAPAVLLLGQARSGRPLMIGTALLLSVASALTVSADSPEIAAVVVAGTVPPLGLLIGWRFFHRVIRELGQRAAEEQAEAARVRLEESRHRASASATLRWRHAGLDRCRWLLSGLADGSLDPGAVSVRNASADEERHLRQVAMLDPELVRSAHLFAASLSRARSWAVPLIVRTGSTDFESDVVARRFAGLVDEIVSKVPAGSAVTASLFMTRQGVRFSVVAPTPHVSARLRLWSAPDAWTVSVTGLGGVELLEAVRDGSASGSREVRHEHA